MKKFLNEKINIVLAFIRWTLINLSIKFTENNELSARVHLRRRSRPRQESTGTRTKGVPGILNGAQWYSY